MADALRARAPPNGMGDVANIGSQLGMMNVLRTGNPMLDMVIKWACKNDLSFSLVQYLIY